MEAAKSGATAAILQEPYVGSEGRRGCRGTRVYQSIDAGEGTVKAAIVVFKSEIKVVQYPNLTTNNIVVVGLRASAWEVVLVSVYFEPDRPLPPYLDQLNQIALRIGTGKWILGGDVNAKSTWWGSQNSDNRGDEVLSALGELDLHLANVGDVPTYDTVRGGVRYTSHVDITACSTPLMAHLSDWKVEEGLTSSDHNAISFVISLCKSRGVQVHRTTRIFNTRKANWSEFREKLGQLLLERSVTTPMVEGVASQAHMEDVVGTLTEAMAMACVQAIPKKSSRENFALPWWSEELTGLKKAVTRMKNRVRCAAPDRRQRVVAEYLEQKRQYEERASQAQVESWRNFCSRQTREGVWEGIHRVIGRTTGREEDVPLRRGDEGLDARESVKLLAETFYPEDSPRGDTLHHTEIRTRAETVNDEKQNEFWDPPFTIAELRSVSRSFNPKKAPGADGFTADICQQAIASYPFLFLAVFNKCLELGHFPGAWKRATVVILRKPGRSDYTVPKSYRPIGLLPVLGKMYEKLIVTRLRFYLVPRISTRQYGFMPQRSTEDSLYVLMQHTRSKLSLKRMVALVSLDIEGAFDSAWWPMIRVRLAEEQCPVNLRRVIDSYLSDREVCVRYCGEEHSRPTNKGCVQGSIGGPLLWNVLLDPLLTGLERDGYYCQAFADDVVLVVDGDTALEVEGRANAALAQVLEWGVGNKLSFAARKTQAMLVTKKLKYDTPRLSMGGVPIGMSKEIKVLGVTIDDRLTFNAHIAEVCTKAADIYKKLARAAKVSWGLHPEIVKIIYTATIEPVILYAASAWAPAANKEGVKKKFGVIQRGIAQKLCKAYRTVSLNAALALAGILPLDLRVHEAAQLYAARKGVPQPALKGRELERMVSVTEIPHPAKLMEHQIIKLANQEQVDEYSAIEVQIFTDGSKIEGKVGAALSIWTGGAETKALKLALPEYCTVFQAELLAICVALKEIRRCRRATTYGILSDSMSALQVIQNNYSLHPLAVEARENLMAAAADDKAVTLFWIKSHVGLVGNERADALAKEATRARGRAVYDMLPVSYFKRCLRADTLEEWNRRYTEGTTASTTKVFFPSVIAAYRVLTNSSMSPSPHVVVMEGVEGARLGGERVVVSGMSGRFPQSRSVADFADILYNKVDPVTVLESRWRYEHPELARHGGAAPALDRFDAQFFSVHYRLGQYLDPVSRLILENTFQALYDAGLSPGHVSQHTSVFVGSAFSATERSGLINPFICDGLGILGANRTMFANRISYWLNLKGPSVTIDEGDCSSTAALEQAYQSIRRGTCDTAIVCGAHLCLHPQELIFHDRMGATARDGKTRSFAQGSSGYVLSDAVGVLVLQKANVALRCYAELVHVCNSFTSMVRTEEGPKYGYCRDANKTAKFIRQFYREARVSPLQVEYVEGYGTGVPDADRSELEAIDSAYCAGRQDTLWVGSVTSNIGVTEAASGMAAITKVLLAYYTGEIAPNLHCESERTDVSCVREGRVRVVTERRGLRRGYCALNGMSSSGVNSHVLLKGHYKPKDWSRYKSSIPHLVVLSGRQEESCQKIIDSLKCRRVDPEEIALLHNIHSKNISGHLGRGYVILDTDAEGQTVSVCEKTEHLDEAARPLWFVYSGMGSQWAGMGAQLMRIPVFAAAVQRCDEVLAPKGLNIVDIITSPHKTMFDNILHAFVGIAAVQIGLTDVLRHLGLAPDGIIGHSVGELGCAYADGCLTAEETILAAWSRGWVSLNTPFIKGSMAAVGLGYEQISPMCPAEIDVACHNGPESSTISGPADVMRSFVAELKERRVFAKEVPSANIAYHSRYIAAAGPSLLKRLKDVIKNPKRRSERWLSTSVPQDKWSHEAAQYCSAEYHTNNLLSPVLFEETIRLVPSNAVLVEVAPHGLLQAILKRSLPVSCKHVPLTQRGHEDNAVHLLQAVGNIYMAGYSPAVRALYPPVQFPVATETPMLSHLVHWVHHDSCLVSTYVRDSKQKAASCRFLHSIHDDEHRYLQGNVIRGSTCYPVAASLVCAWELLAMSVGARRGGVSVQFRELRLRQQPRLLRRRPLALHVALHRGSGYFEVRTEFSKVISGYITVRNDRTHHKADVNITREELTVSSEDVYKLLYERGYQYSGEFRSILEANEQFSKAAVTWRDNWVTLVDGMLQLHALRQKHAGVSLPTHVVSLHIDVHEHARHVHEVQGERFVYVAIDELHDVTRCGGVTMTHIKHRHLPATAPHAQWELYSPSSHVDNVHNKQNFSSPVTNRTLQIAESGNLATLQWVPAPTLEPSNLNVQVQFAGLSVRDARRASDAAATHRRDYGMDYSGITASGERVMGILAGGAASGAVRAVRELSWPVPAHWTLEDAATVPLPYAHAFYLLAIRCTLLPGMSVLVAGGAGALGQAAIAVALAHRCRVYATVGDATKKRFLMRRFPQLKEEHICNSRDVHCADAIALATQGTGCDIVISCLPGKYKQAFLQCGGMFSVFLDTAQLEDGADFTYGMHSLELDRSYIPTDFSSLFTQHRYDDMKAIQRMLSEGIAAGYVVPLPRVTYASREAARAFSLLAASQHRGRVLLRVGDHDAPLQRRVLCEGDKCQLIYSNSDTLAAALADRLAARGARLLYIHCTQLTNYLHIKIRGLQRAGVNVVVSSEDLTHLSEEAVREAARRAPVEAIYALISDTSEYTTTRELNTVVHNFDVLSKSCPQLRYFVVTSTMAGVGRDTCLCRAQRGEPATYLDVSGMSHEEVRDSRVLSQLTEQALSTDRAELRVRRKDAPNLTLLEQLLSVAGGNSPPNIEPHVTLRELGVADEHARWISAYLSLHYNVTMDDDDIPLLAVEDINNLQSCVIDVPPADVRGLATFFSHVGDDELTATTDVVLLPTLCSEALSLDEFEVGERYLYIVPGMEGHHERFRALCERLKVPALVLQPGLGRRETVRDMALRYAQILKNKAYLQDNFYILGYESGVLVALELVHILEQQGLKGTLICVGLPPEELQTELEDQLREYTSKEQLQHGVLRHMFTLLTGGDLAVLEAALQRAHSWTEKVATCLSLLTGRMSHTAQFARALIETVMARIEQTRSYTPTLNTVQSRLIFLRAATSSQKASIQHLARDPVVVHQLQSPLCHALSDPQCPSLINRSLDSDLQRAFQSKNICHSYVTPKDNYAGNYVNEIN